MKLYFLTLVLVAALTSFAGSAKAQSFDIYTGPWSLSSGQSLLMNWSPSSSYTVQSYPYRTMGSVFLAPTQTQPDYGFGYGSSTNPAMAGSWGGSSLTGSTSELNSGAVIGTGTTFSGWNVIEPSGGSSASYMGLAYDLGDGNYNYGWMKYSTSSDSSTITFLGAAMNTTTNESILAGQVPEPSALSLLAVGLGALAMMRRRRS